LVAVEAGWDAPVIASASTATADRRTIRILNPPGLRRLVQV
jgi:hypothetical protein